MRKETGNFYFQPWLRLLARTALNLLFRFFMFFFLFLMFRETLCSSSHNSRAMTFQRPRSVLTPRRQRLQQPPKGQPNETPIPNPNLQVFSRVLRDSLSYYVTRSVGRSVGRKSVCLFRYFSYFSAF